MKKSRTILTGLSVILAILMGIVITEKWDYLGKPVFDLEEMLFLIFLAAFLFSLYLRSRFKI